MECEFLRKWVKISEEVIGMQVKETIHAMTIPYLGTFIKFIREHKEGNFSNMHIHFLGGVTLYKGPEMVHNNDTGEDTETGREVYDIGPVVPDKKDLDNMKNNIIPGANMPMGITPQMLQQMMQSGGGFRR